jgi:hypothetical protein
MGISRMERDERLRTKLYSVFNMGYKKLFNYLVLIGMGGLGLFNSSKLEIRYETNSNLELLCQNGMIISAVAIIYFTLAFFVELMVMKKRKKVYRIPSRREYDNMKITPDKKKEEE